MKITALQARQRVQANRECVFKESMKEIERAIECASYWGHSKVKEHWYWRSSRQLSKEERARLTTIFRLRGFSKVRITTDYFSLNWEK